MAISGAELFQRIIGKGGLGIYMPEVQVDSLTADALTSVLWLRNANWGTNQLLSQESLIFRPDALTRADYVRYAANLSAALGAVVPDSSWADVDKTGEDFYILKGGVHPQWIVDAMNRALGKCYTENSEPLSLALDAGFQSTSTSAYVESDADGGPVCTFIKVTTLGSQDIFSGIASGRVLNSQAGGYIRQRFYVHPGEPLHVGALSRASVGTAALVLWDVTNNVEIGAAIEHDGQQWGYLWRQDSVPPDCNQVEVRLLGEESNADIFWNALWVYRVNDNRMQLASTWDTEFKVPSLAAARFGASVSGAQQVQGAFSLDLVEIPPANYGFLFERPGAHPAQIQFHRTGAGFYSWPYNSSFWPNVGFGGPVYIQGRRAYADFSTFGLDLSQFTTCDLDLLDAASRIEVFLDQRIASKVTDAETRLADAYGEFLQVNQQFQQRGPAKRAQTFVWPMARN